AGVPVDLFAAVQAGLSVGRHAGAGHRRLQQPRSPGGQLGGAVRDVVDLEVVRVAVVAVPVVPDQHVGVLLVEDGGQLLRDHVDVGAVHRPLGVVLVPAAHAGVGVAEPHDLLGA